MGKSVKKKLTFERTAYTARLDKAQSEPSHLLSFTEERHI